MRLISLMTVQVVQPVNGCILASSTLENKERKEGINVFLIKKLDLIISKFCLKFHDSFLRNYALHILRTRKMAKCPWDDMVTFWRLTTRLLSTKKDEFIRKIRESNPT